MMFQVVRTRVDGVHSRHEGASAWGADGVDVVVVQDDSRVGQGVNVGGGDLVGAMEADIIPALKIPLD